MHEATDAVDMGSTSTEAGERRILEGESWKCSIMHISRHMHVCEGFCGAFRSDLEVLGQSLERV